MKAVNELKWFVQIFESLDGGEKLERELGPYASERIADKADDGVNRNLNHERFFTRVVSRLRARSDRSANHRHGAHGGCVSKSMRDSTPYDGHVYFKIRRVPIRMYSSSEAGRYEAKLIGFLGFNRGNCFGTLATTRGHTTAEAARVAILKLADRRGIKVTDDPRAVRMIEYRDRYGDLDAACSTSEGSDRKPQKR